MNAGDCTQIRTALGVYLLGAIEPHERPQLADHLASCLACREVLAALAGLPALLQKVPADEAIRASMDDSAHQLPGPPLETLLAEVARTRRRRRRQAIAAGAVLAAALAPAGLKAFHLAATASRGAGRMYRPAADMTMLPRGSVIAARRERRGASCGG